MSIFRYIFFITLFTLPVTNIVFSQKDKDIKDQKAIDYFIEGKTYDIKNDYATAIEFYLKALNYEKSPGIFFAISQAYTNLNRYRDALNYINQALIISPSNEDYLLLKGQLLLALGNTNEAMVLYEKLIQIHPDNIQTLYNLARIYEEQKRSADALLLYEKIIDEFGFEQEVLRRTYDIYFSFKEYDKCIEIVGYFLKLDPYNKDYRLRLGGLYQITGDYAKSLKVYQELFRLNPDDKSIQQELVKLYFYENNPERGFIEFAKISGKDTLTYEEKLQIGEIYYNLIPTEKEAVRVAKNIFSEINSTYPDKWQPYFYLGAIDISENGNSYIEIFEKALAYADTNKEAYVQIAYSLFNKGDYEKSMSVIDKVYSISDYRMNYIYGLCLQRTGKLEEATDYYNRALKIAPEDISLLSSLGLIYNTMKKYDKSDEAYEKALKIDPENALVLNNYAYNLSVRGANLVKALDMIRKAVQKEPKNANFLDTMGWVYYMLGEYDLAEKYILESLALNASSAVVQEHLGDVYKSMKQTEKAKIQYKKALELNPTNESIKQKLENLR